MPQHKSAEKRVRQNAKRRLRNRYHKARMRSMIKQLRQTRDQATAQPLLQSVKAHLDRMASRGIIHPNMAANYKSQLEQLVNGLA
jgi:small subunit ribosomal protein S20